MLAEYLAVYFQDAELKQIFNDVMETEQIHAIQSLIDQKIKNILAEKIVKTFFIQASIEVVFGLQLANTQKIVLKVYSPKLLFDYLAAMHHIQQIFDQENFPTPKTFSSIFKFGLTHAEFYELIEGDSIYLITIIARFEHVGENSVNHPYKIY